MTKTTTLIAAALLWIPLAFSEKLPKPDRVGADATAAEAALINQGVALHDRQDYDGAIALYKQVLAGSPTQVTALYEMSYSLFSARRYEDSLAVARDGIRYRSEKLPYFYVMMGNSLDELGKSAEAIAVYSDAAKANPSIELLHYNLGISLSRAGKKSEARHALQTALHLAPNHASAHAALASVYRDMGYRIPAALAYSRFLTLEPESARAVNALPILQSLLLGGVSATDSSHISIAVQRDKKGAEEGDFGPAEIAVSISVAANIMAKPALAEHQKSSAFDQMVAAVYSILGESLGYSKPKRRFAATYYAPYFVAVEKAGHTRALVSEIGKAGNVDGLAAWAGAHNEEIVAFRTWSQNYLWPR